MNHNNDQRSMITMNLKENKGQGGTWESWIKEREGVNNVIINSKKLYFLNEAVIILIVIYWICKLVGKNGHHYEREPFYCREKGLSFCPAPLWSLLGTLEKQIPHIGFAHFL